MESNSEQYPEVPPPYKEFPGPGLQPGQPPMAQPDNNSYPMVQQPVIIYQASLPLDRKPTSMPCPRCHANIVTKISFKVGTRGWKFFGLMCFVGFWCGCCLLPFFYDNLKVVDHHCPLCKAYIGRCIY